MLQQEKDWAFIFLCDSTEPNSPDDLFLKLRVFGSLTRGEYCRCALRFIAGVAAKTEVGVEAAGSNCEEGISRREVSVEACSMLLSGPGVNLPLELELFAMALPIVARLAFGKKSLSACLAFRWRS